jgi:lysozyme family protein
MANFDNALRHILQHEGGYVSDPADPGGETYKGVARKMNSAWKGWVEIDMAKGKPGFPANLETNTKLQEMIRDFYKVNYWDKICGTDIENENVALSIFDFAVNAGVSTSASLAQKAVDVKPDGVIGPVSVKAINLSDADHFIASFTVLKIARYVTIVKNRPESKKYFYGWVCRALNC